MIEAPKAAHWRGRIGSPHIESPDWVLLTDDVAIPAALHCHLEGAEDVGGRWPDVLLSFAVRDGVPECVEYRVVSSPGARPARPDMLAVDDVRRIGDWAFSVSAMSYDPVEGSMTAWEAPSTRSIVGRATREATWRARAASEHPGSPSMEELRQVARVYLDPLSAPKRAEAVWGALYPDKTIATANRRIRAARDASLIPPVGASDEEFARAWQRLNVTNTRTQGAPVDAAAQRAKLDRILFGEEGQD